jgi:SAM-dependent methyltransferase
VKAPDTPVASVPWQALVPRACPVCGNTDGTRELYPERLSAKRLDAMSYASRKEPDYMSLRMVVCPHCDLLYAPRIPPEEFLARAYAETGYDSGAEARAAAASYAEALSGMLDQLPDRASALEIGTGNGALLTHLQEFGFGELVGIEPSREAARGADRAVRDLIRVEGFDPSLWPAGHFTLVIANQTLEHVHDPFRLLGAARRLLRPGGALMIVSHNYRHWLMRLLGARSPIIDIEHLQVFSPASLAFSLRRAGFGEPRIRSFVNRYPLRYWVRLMPVPALLKRPMLAQLGREGGVGGVGGVGGWMLAASVGNMMAWARVGA